MQRPRTSAPTWLSLVVMFLLLSSTSLFILGTRPVYATAGSPTKVTLSGHPNGAALDYSNHDIYIANYRGYVLVLDPTTNTIVKNITTGAYTSYIAYDNATTNLFATNSSDVVIISGSANAVIGKVLTPNFGPIGIVAGNGQVFVTGSVNTGGAMLKVINTQTLKTTANVTLPSIDPGTPAYDPVDNRVYVPDYYLATGYANQTSVVDLATKTIVDNVITPNGPYIASYGFGKVYVAEAGSSNVAVIDPATDNVVSNLTVAGAQPDGIAFAYNPAVGVSSYGSGSSGNGTVTWLDPFTGLIFQFTIDSYGPQFIVYDPYEHVFYVFDYDGDCEVYPWTDEQTTSSTSTPASSTTSSSSGSSTTTITSMTTPSTTSTTTSKTSSTLTSSATSGTSTSTTSTTSRTTAPAVTGNPLIDWILYLLFILVLGAILFGYWRYRQGSKNEGSKPEPPPGSTSSKPKDNGGGPAPPMKLNDDYEPPPNPNDPVVEIKSDEEEKDTTDTM